MKDKDKQVEEELSDLRKELDEFRREKERIRAIVGRLGGMPSFNSKVANMAFIILVSASLVISLLTEDTVRLAMIDIAVGIVSMKLLYLIHNLTRVVHFELWILSSLEWQINEMRKGIHKAKEG